jgi:hypothetical protein
MARLEEVEKEADLLALARHASASQLERVVRAYRGVVAVERAAHGGRPERWCLGAAPTTGRCCSTGGYRRRRARS